MISEFKFAIINLLIHPWEERLTCFDCKQVSPAISLFVFLLTKNNTTSSPGFLCQRFYNLQRAALLTLLAEYDYEEVLSKFSQQQLVLVNCVCGFNQLETE